MNFLTPLFFSLAVLLPFTVAIYFLRRRYQDRKVGSLLLWQEITGNDTKGTVVRRQRLPWILLLELLILTLLIVASASPNFQIRKLPAVVCLLDNSWSMQANDSSPRKNALLRLQNMIESENREFILVKVGADAAILGKVSSNNIQFSQAIDGWRCDESDCDMIKAIAWIKKVYPLKDIRVFSDKAPKSKNELFVDLFTFGQPSRNVAIINARRKRSGKEDLILCELFNASGSKAKVNLSVSSENKQVNKQIPFTLEANEKLVKRFNIPAGVGKVTLSIPADALATDNTITLLPEAKKRVRVKLDFKTLSNKKQWEKVLKIIDFVKVVENNADLLICDYPAKSTTKFVVEMTSPKSPVAFIGPYVKEQNHDILEGVIFDGVVWAADAKFKSLDEKILSVGNLPLMVSQARGQQQRLILNLSLNTSNLSRQPIWPALVWNIIDNCYQNKPGIKRFNYQQNEHLSVWLSENISSVNLTSPTGKKETVNVQLNSLFFPLNVLGLYSISVGKKQLQIMVNPFDAAESNLQNCEAKENVHKVELINSDEFVSVTWIFLLAAILLLFLHHYLIYRGER